MITVKIDVTTKRSIVRRSTMFAKMPIYDRIICGTCLLVGFALACLFAWVAWNF